MKEVILSFALLFFTTAGFAQKWKAYLDSSTIYLKKDYKKALDFILLSKESLPSDSVGTLSYAKIINELGNLYIFIGNYEKAEQVYIEAKSIREKVLGKEDTDYAQSCNNLAVVYYNIGQYEKAEPLYIEAKNIKEKILGKSHPGYATSLNNLAILYYYTRQYEKAEPLYIEAKNITEKTLGKRHPDYVNSLNNLALLYSDIGENRKAESLYVEAKDIIEINFGNDGSEYAQSCNNLAIIYKKTARYEKAEPLYIEAKNIREKLLGKEHPEYASSLNNLAILYDDMGLFKKSEPLYIEAKNIREKALGKEHPDYAQSCNNLAVLYYHIGQFEKAELLYIEAKNIREKAFGKMNTDYASSLNNLALLYKDMGRYEKAEPLFIEAKNIRENILGKEHPYYANTINNLAILYSAMGQYEKAETLYLEAKTIREKNLGREHPEYASCLNNLAIFYNDMGRYEEAEPLYLEAKNIRERTLGKEHPDYANSLNNLAALYFNKGQYEKAEALYLETKNIQEKALGKDHPDFASSISNLALLYYNMGQYEKAESLYLQAKNIQEKSLGKFNPIYAALLNNIGVLYKDMGLYEKAEPFYIEAKNIREKTVGKNHPDYAQSCNNLAILYKNLEQYEKAELLYLEAKNTIERTLGKVHPDYAAALNNLAVLYNGMNKFGNAEPLFIEAKNIREKILGKGHGDFAQSCNNLAELYWITNHPTKAEALYKEAFNIKNQQVQKILQFTSEKQKSDFIKNIMGSNDIYNSFYYQSYSHNNGAEPFTIAFLSRNLILSSSQKLRKVIYKSNDKNATVDYEKWNRIKKQIANFYSKGKTGPAVKNLEDSADVLEKSLSQSSAAFKNQLANKNWQNIQQSLKDNETAIEFADFQYYTGKRWTDSTYYIALVLRKDKPEPIMVPLFEKKQLDSILLQTGNKNSNDNVKALYASRGVTVGNNVVVSKSLYNLIWKPLEKELKGIHTIYFAPAGALHRIAFAALPVDDNQVLSDQYILVQLATTASIIDQQPFYVSASDKINLYGGIKYSVDSTTLKTAALAYEIKKGSSSSLPEDLSRGGETWNDLPGTAKEVEDILAVAKNKNNISILTGINATEESIKALEGKNSPVILHIASHGFFFPDPKKEKKKDNNLETGLDNGKAFKQSDDPLFRSGLLFAGANNTWNGKAVEGIEDGILTSYEVSNMYLPNTKLVILSACETALGDIKGNEGVYGLQRAFKMAGVENLIMSLWKVPDSETAEFMQELYKNLFAHQSIGDAFNNAQRTMKTKYRNDPYKWAAWVMVR